LGKQDYQNNYGSSHPKQDDAAPAALSALTAPTIQLNKTDDQQNGCTANEPTTERLRPHAETRQFQLHQENRTAGSKPML
jgi:hypothetical protein